MSHLIDQKTETQNSCLRKVSWKHFSHDIWRLEGFPLVSCRGFLPKYHGVHCLVAWNGMGKTDLPKSSLACRLRRESHIVSRLSNYDGNCSSSSSSSSPHVTTILLFWSNWGWNVIQDRATKQSGNNGEFIFFSLAQQDWQVCCLFLQHFVLLTWDKCN